MPQGRPRTFALSVVVLMCLQGCLFASDDALDGEDGQELTPFPD